MLIKQAHLQGIRSGAISLAFRKWKQARVRKGSLIKSPVGLIEIKDIAEVGIDSITPQDAANAGFEQLDELLAILEKVSEGSIYKISLSYYGEDPRLKLRAQCELSNQEYEELKIKVSRLDKYSKQGDWVMAVLEAVSENPQLRAEDLAAKLNKEKAWLKPNIRKLKNLGLTISHEIGYSLSPLGEYFFNRRTEEMLADKE